MSTAPTQLSGSEAREARRWLHLAARAALRSFGNAEPNPMVGCAIVKNGGLLAVGHHLKFGGLHAEREALARCRELGHDPAGATAYVTLEPCCHTGKQPPCTEALLEAKIARVVAARPDPGPESGGGFAVLRHAGIECVFCAVDPLAVAVGEPFVRRLATGRPWVIAKWAQTLDGRIATRTGESQWISSPAARARVHRLRGRVDAILTGVGTVLADDPTLNARPTRSTNATPRRVARRVVVDSSLRTPPGSKLVRTARELPLTLYAGEVGPEQAHPFVNAGVEVVEGPGIRPGLAETLGDLHGRLGVATVLVEAGPTLLGSLFHNDLIDQAVVHLAPTVIGDSHARAAVEGREVPALGLAKGLSLCSARSIGPDLELVYTRA